MDGGRSKMVEPHPGLDLPAQASPAAWKRAALGISAVLSALVFVVLFPETASRIGRELRFGIILPCLFCVLAAYAVSVRGAHFIAASFVLVASFIFLQLWWLWYAGPSDTMLLGGFLPFSDASDYLVNAQVLAAGGRIQGQGHANDHLLASAMLAVLWKLTHGDYRFILILLNLFGAASAWLALREVCFLLGPGAGAAWLLVDTLFLRRFIGMPLSEHLGLILGCLGLALGCRAVRLSLHCYWIAAIFAMALALCARSGAVFTIPALILGAVFALPRKGNQRWMIPVAMSASAFVAFLLDKLLTQAVGNRSPAADISNAVYHLHSLVFGGSWTDAMNLYGNDRLAVWRAVQAQLRAHPFSLLSGGERSLVAIIRQGYLFTFVNLKWLSLVLHLAFATGSVAVLFSLRHEKRAWWLFALLAGLLASMPMLPPWNTDNMRVYAATIPLIAFTVAVGIYCASSLLRSRGVVPAAINLGSLSGLPQQPSDLRQKPSAWAPEALLATVVLLSAVLPLFFHAHELPWAWSIEDSYRTNKTDAPISYSSQVALRLVSNSDRRGPLALRVDDFRAGLAGFASLYPGEAAFLGSLPPECSILPTSHEFTFIAVDESHVPVKGQNQDLNIPVRFIAEGWLLVAVDQSLIARSKSLANYISQPLGAFSFGINRYPVIRDGDVVTLVENVDSIDFMPPSHSGRTVNALRPYLVGSRRLRFPVPGEYYLQINQKFSLKILVIDRASSDTEANRLIEDFVAANCTLSQGVADEGFMPGEKVNPSHFFESKTPVPLSWGAMLHLVDELKHSFSRSRI
jgi:hypothetical protein